MRWRRKRGTALQELGKTVGGVLAMFGTFLFLKAAGTQPHEEAYPLRGFEIGLSGDLYAAFPPAHLPYIKWIGVAMVIGGTLLRFKSYWKVYGTEEKK